MSLFAVALSGMVLATAYVLLAALPDPRAGMLYSLSALTTYGHASALLPDHWKMLGALEALNGVLLFGLTTAFLFAMIQGLVARKGQPPGMTECECRARTSASG